VFDFFTPFSQPLLVNFQVLSTAIPQRASPNTFCEESPAACFKIAQKIPLQRCSVERDYMACYIPSARLDCFYSCVMVWWNVMHTLSYFTALVICTVIPSFNLIWISKDHWSVFYPLMHRLNSVLQGVQSFQKTVILQLMLACHLHWQSWKTYQLQYKLNISVFLSGNGFMHNHYCLS